MKRKSVIDLKTEFLRKVYRSYRTISKHNNNISLKESWRRACEMNTTDKKILKELLYFRSPFQHCE